MLRKSGFKKPTLAQEKERAKKKRESCQSGTNVPKIKTERMKRTPLSRGTKTLKRSGFNQNAHKVKIKHPKGKKTAPKKKKTTVRQLKDKLWNEVKRLTRERYGDTCYTCGATNLVGSNLHSGHGKPMGALPLRFKYDIRNIRPQCMVDNIHRGGCQDIFIAKLEQEEDGIAFLLEACYLDEDSNAWRIRQDTPTMGGKDATIFVENLLKTYKAISYAN